MFQNCIQFLFKRRDKIWNYVRDGGMPSSHSALITGATSGIGYELGFDSSIFALSVAIALIVMYDASGVRKSAGIQAAEINKLSKKLDPQSELLLKETLGGIQKLKSWWGVF